jgi:hypothetical protein
MRQVRKDGEQEWGFSSIHKDGEMAERERAESAIERYQEWGE